MDQRSEEWYEARRGKLTASRVSRLMDGSNRAINTLLDVLEREITEGKGGWLEGRDADSASMEHGRAMEPRAIAMYEMLYDVDVTPVGLVYYEPFDFIGASPDGLVPGGSIEVKCPSNPANHDRAIIYGMPKDHYWQVQTQSLCLGVEWVDFISYSEVPKQVSKWLYRERIKANAKDQQKIVEKARWLKDLLDSGERASIDTSTIPEFF